MANSQLIKAGTIVGCIAAGFCFIAGLLLIFSDHSGMTATIEIGVGLYCIGKSLLITTGILFYHGRLQNQGGANA